MTLGHISVPASSLMSPTNTLSGIPRIRFPPLALAPIFGPLLLYLISVADPETERPDDGLCCPEHDKRDAAGGDACRVPRVSGHYGND